MKPSDLMVALKAAFLAKEPVLIVSSPGLGKSSIVAQATASLGYDLQISHPVTADPTDAKGLPWPNAKHTAADFLPFGHLERAINAPRPLVWFLDDLGQALPAVQASFMQLILAREVNGKKVSDFVIFVAATNKRTDRAGVSGILEPVKSRFTTIIVLEEDTPDWTNWAFENNIDPRLIGFMQLRGDELLCNFQATADMTNSPVPRTWRNASAVLDMTLPQHIENEMLKGAVGEGAALELIAFLDMYKQLPSIQAILDDPDGQAIPENPSVLYAIATGLARLTTTMNFDSVARYTQRLVDTAHGEIAALLILYAERQEPEIHNTPEFVELMSGELGQLVAGAVR